MNKIVLALKSRTFWTLVAMFVYNGVGAIHSSIPASISPIVNSLLGLMVVYFHITPSQDYTKGQ